jgi:hypothetical protein
MPQAMQNLFTFFASALCSAGLRLAIEFGVLTVPHAVIVGCIVAVISVCAWCAWVSTERTALIYVASYCGGIVLGLLR